MTTLRTVAVLLALALVAQPARSQSTLVEIGGAPGEQIGLAVAFVGDVTGDGRSDFAVGVPVLAGTTAGEVRVYCGSTGALLRTLPGPVDSHLGRGVVAIGDIDGDLVPDIAACGNGIGGLHGSVGSRTMVFSGATGSVIWSIFATGVRLAAAGDVNGDGKGDVIVADDGLNNGINASASVRVLSGANGAQLASSTPTVIAPGISVAEVGDVNGDGQRDYGWAYPTEMVVTGTFPRLRIYSGNGGGFVTDWPGTFVHFGGCMAALGDVNGDGRIDVAVGSDDGAAARADIVSGAGGATLFALTGSAGFGASVGNAGDIDGDGRNDVIVGNPSAGEARVFSSATGLELLILRADSSNDRFGKGVRGGGDANGDGFADLLVGAALDDDGGMDSGSVRVASSVPLLPRAYCTAKVNSLGCTPAIAFLGTPSASATIGFQVRATSVRNKKNGLLFYGLQGSAALAFSGGTLCVATPVKRTSAVNSGGSPTGNDCSGVYSLDFNAFAHGALGGNPDPALLVAGTAVCCQWWGRDPGFAAPNNTTLSNALRFELLP